MYMYPQEDTCTCTCRCFSYSEWNQRKSALPVEMMASGGTLLSICSSGGFVKVECMIEGGVTLPGYSPIVTLTHSPNTERNAQTPPTNIH